MAFWNRQPPESKYPARVVRPTFEGLTAAAQPFDIDNAADRKRLAKLQEQWQVDAWLYLDRIGELKDAYRFVENSFRRLRVYAAFQRSPDEEPIPVMDATKAPDGDVDVPAEDLLPMDVAELAESIMADFAARDGGQGSLLARLGTNIFMVGEALIIQRAVPERRPMEGETPDDVPQVWDWEVRSTHEVREDRSGRGIETFDSPDQQHGVPVVGLGDIPPFVERIYRKHAQWSNWADSNVKAAIDTLEEMRLLGLVARASLRSRAMAGFFTVPEELDFGGTDLPGGAPGPTTQGVTFERSMAEAYAAAIGNEADPNSVAQILVRGKAEFLRRDVFGPIEVPRRYGADERAQYEDAVRKLARTIELPQESLTGAENVSHWGLWQLDETRYRAYIEPLALVGNEGLAYGLLRPRLRDEGVDERWTGRIVAVVDATDLIRRADVGKVADGLHEGMVISDEARRRANGFGDDDAPSDEELLRRWILRSNVSPDLLPQLLRLAELIGGDMAMPLMLVPGTPAADQPVMDGMDPEHGPPPEGDREPMPPPSESMTAALAASRDIGRALASIDTVLSERLLIACDQAVTRVLERVGARLRSKPRSGQPAELRTALAAAKDIPNSHLVQHLDPVLVAAAVGPEPVTDDDFADIRDRFDAWVIAAQDAALRELTSSAGDGVTDTTLARARETQRQDRDDAWAVLLAALVAYTLGLIARNEDVLDQTGEWDPTITVAPSIIRESMALAGGSLVEHGPLGGVFASDGGPLGGVATGGTMQQAFRESGFAFGESMWEYGSAHRERNFEPHLALDGEPYSNWGGYAPGDHRWCLCSSVPNVSPVATSATVAA